MELHSSKLAALLLGASMAALAAGAAAAQDAGAAPASDGLLGEVVVTATRQADTVSRVPLSITAVTQKSLEQQGVKDVQDLSRTVPAVTFRRSGSDSVPNVSIRGISASLGGATTGVYLDDTPLAKRNTLGLVTGNGSPFPVLFDLERVEVLKGPQGTLFGASSEGGTVRFITPPPSLTRYSANIRTEVSTTKGGALSYEGGAALGGPLIEGKLGFRASVWARRIGGYIDHVSIYDGHTFDKNSNSGEQRVARFALAWAPTERLRVSPSYYYSLDAIDDGDTWWQDVPQHTVNAGVFTNVANFAAALPTRFNFNLPDKFYAGGVYGPYNQYGPYKSGAGTYLNESDLAMPQRSARRSVLRIPSLTIDYDFGAFSAKAITSYVYDRTIGPVQANAAFTGTNYAPAGGSFGPNGEYLPCTATQATGCASNATYVIPGTNTPVPGGFGASPLIWNGFPTQLKEYVFENVRRSFTQEIRFSSNPGEGRFSWVAGAFFTRGAQRQPGSTLSSDNDLIYFIRGVDEAFTAYMPPLSGSIFEPGTPRVAQVPFTIVGGPTLVGGVPTYDVVQNAKVPASAGTDASRRLAVLDEKEYAAFAEVNYMLTAKLKVTAGARVSRIRTSYTQTQSGPIFGPPLDVFTPTPTHPWPNQPGDKYENTASGVLKEKPFNPKVGISYQATERNLFYATVAKGYRAGSVNTPGTLAQCTNDVAALGRPTPLTYDADSVMSYEGGAKVRVLGNRMQLNTSAFYIDWKDPQLTVNLRCGFSYVTNAKGAVSKGFDLQGQFRALSGLTVNFAAGYTDAHYTSEFSFPAPGGATVLMVRKGEPLGVPKWQYNIGLQYDFSVLGRPSYVRTDYQYAGVYQRGSGVGTATYNAVTVKGADTRFMTARAGVNFRGFDASLFVNNLTNSKDLLNEGNGRSSPLRTASTYRPREIGVQLSYRY